MKKSSRSLNWPTLGLITGLSFALSGGAAESANGRARGAGAAQGQLPPPPLSNSYAPPAPMGPPVRYNPTPGAVFPDPYKIAPARPLLPPGTSQFTADAVQRSYDAGTLTQRQAESVSQLYEPMYGPLPGLTAAQIMGAGPGGLIVDNRVDIGGGQLGTIVDFGSAAAAQAALDAYMKNFR